MLASRHGYKSIVELFVMKGADVNAKSDGVSGRRFS